VSVVSGAKIKPSRFDIVRKLGAGGMGEVFLAKVQSPEGERLVALKRIRADLREREDLLTQFQREARVCQLLSHPNIVTLEDWGVDEEGPFLALEYVRGQPVAGLLKAYRQSGRNLPIEAGLSLCIQVGRALSYAHGIRAPSAHSGIVHRDVSPDNVLLSFDGVAKLSDFGIAKLSGTTRVTTTGTAKGKYGYMAPELFEGHDATPEADIFAFGVLCYELLCGVRPFAGKTEAEILRAVLHAEPPAPEQLRHDISHDVSAAIQQCLRKNPHERPHSVANCLLRLEAASPQSEEALRALLARTMSETFASEVLAAPHQPSGKKRVTQQVAITPLSLASRVKRFWPLGLALAVAVGALVVGGTLWGNPTPRPSPEAPPQVTPAPAETTAQAPTTPPAPEEPAPSLDLRGPDPRLASKRAASAAPKTRLWVKVSPWGQVFVDGTLWGTTPVRARPISPGTHSVIVVNPELNARKHFQVQVKRGEERTVKVDLTP
jgi:eukaryotic-like serine/threonine-protein kinase